MANLKKKIVNLRIVPHWGLPSEVNAARIMHGCCQVCPYVCVCGVKFSPLCVLSDDIGGVGNGGCRRSQTKVLPWAHVCAPQSSAGVRLRLSTGESVMWLLSTGESAVWHLSTGDFVMWRLSTGESTVQNPGLFHMVWPEWSVIACSKHQEDQSRSLASLATSTVFLNKWNHSFRTKEHITIWRNWTHTEPEVCYF